MTQLRCGTLGGEFPGPFGSEQYDGLPSSTTVQKAPASPVQPESASPYGPGELRSDLAAHCNRIQPDLRNWRDLYNGRMTA